MITEGQAKFLKQHIWNSAGSILARDNITPELVLEVNKAIDESVSCAADEPRMFHFKNIIAFLTLLQDKPLIEWHPTSIAAKFDRFCLSKKPDEYKWGIFPGLYGQIYRYFYKWDVELDTGERLARETHFQDPRWVYENTEDIDTDFKEAE